MLLPRCCSWTLLAAAGFALLAADPQARFAGTARAQDKNDLPRRPDGYSKSLGYKTSPIPPEKLKDAQDAFKGLAKYFADYVAHPRVYSAPQEFKSETAPAVPQPESLETLMTQLREFIWVPQPDPKVAVQPRGDNAVYIAELAAELDAALLKVITDNTTPVVRLNATRMLAVACRSGAEVHYKTVTDLITDPNKPLEIKYYAYQAAGNLLAAYDFADYRSRKHSILDRAKLGKLIRVLNEAVVAPVSLSTGGAKDGKGTAPTPEQLAVHGVVRREAVRALAKVRFASVEDENKVVLYPVHTLARIATSDPALKPAPGTIEIAEAVIGICGMSPLSPPGPAKGYNADAVAEAVGMGLKAFAGPRAGNPSDKSIAWTVYGARLGEALRTWRGLFDPVFDPANINKANLALTPKSVEDVATAALTKIVAPIEKRDPSARVDLGPLTAVVDELKNSKKRSAALFSTDVPKTTLDTLAK